MTPNQKMTGENGLQNALFPLTYLVVTSGENAGDVPGTTGHNGRMIIDFSGWGESGKIYKCPLYAPCDIKCVHVGASSVKEPSVTWESIDKVNFVDGTVDYITISVSHDDNFASYKIGDTRNQGDVFSHTGTTGVGTGDHTHMIVGKGKYIGYGNLGKGWTLKNEYHIYNALGINDTVVRNTGGYNWKEFTPYVPPEPTKKDDFIVLSIVGALKWSV